MASLINIKYQSFWSFDKLVLSDDISTNMCQYKKLGCTG
jgi:hypothetical protein